MGTLTYQEVLQAATQLTPDERGRLLVDLKSTLETNGQGEQAGIIDWELRAKITAEFERRKAEWAGKKVESLHGKFAHPGTQHVSDEEFHEYFRELSREWETELDELFDEREGS